jgi:eukaryotic-like serine/threonine-protein kinase
MLQPGQIVGGKYRLDRVIGQGAFATVWAATSAPSGRPVAVKVLADAPARRPSTVARFLKEARICATSIHPAIVSVEDLGQTDEGVPYLVMELLEGHTLDQVLRVKGSLPWTMAVEILTQLLEGLAAAHGLGIIHRDIKPANIFLVDPTCPGPPVRLLDLGLARDLADDQRLTRTGQVVGTANYLPPETLLDQQPKGGTKSGDVFASGMVLFVSLTGRFPFLTNTGAATPAAEVFARAMFYKSGAALPGPTDVDPSIPRPVDLVVRRALALAPSQRYADAGAMLAALRAATQELLRPSSPEELSQNLAKTCLGTPSVVADLGLDALAAEEPEVEVSLGSFAPLAPSPTESEIWSPQPPEPWASPPSGQSSRPPVLPAGVVAPPGGNAPLPAPLAALPIMMVGSSPQPPPLDAGVGSGRGRGRGRESLPARSSAPGRPGGSSLPPRPTRPSWLRRSRIGLSLLGAGVGTVIGVLLLGAVAAWHFAGRPEPVEGAARPPATAPRVVEVPVRGLPAGAQVRLDGRPLSGAVIRGVEGSRVVLEVDAATYEPLRLELQLQDGAAVDLGGRLRPRRAP